MGQAKVHVDTHYSIAKIDKRIYSGFLEHLGRAVYEGVYDPSSPLSNAQGFREDVLEALRPLKMPLVRYPGGNFVSCYDWTDGIGPREQRPTRPDFAWRSLETNQFGTDEFMQWCSQQGTAPMMAVNLGTGSTSGAAALLEYCNLPTGTYWANLRAKNAQAEPYNVRTWCLGNEMDGEWQAGHVPADVYAQRANQASKMMKGLDPSIETIACGSAGYGMSTYLSWDREILEYCWNTIDYLSVHRYSNNNRDDSAWFLAEGAEIDRVLEDYSGLLAYVRGVKKSDKKVYLSFDEWNVWYKNMEMDGHGQKAPHLIEEIYNLEDALVCAQYLNSFIRHADVVKIACIAQITNVIAPVLTRPEGLLKQSIYYPFVLFSQYANGTSLTPSIQSPTYQAGERGPIPALDASVSYDEQGQTATFFLVNRQQSEELIVDLEIADLPIGEVLSVDLLGGGDVKAANSWEQPNLIKPVSGKAEVLDTGSVRVTVPAPGLAVVHTSLKAH